MFVDTYLIQVFIIPEKCDELITAIKKVSNMKYGHYQWVYWKSEAGEEFYNVLKEAEPDKEVDEEKTYSHKTVKIEFSIPRNEEELERIIQAIWSIHPWKEPVIRVMEARDTRK